MRPFRGTTYFEWQIGPLVIQRRIVKKSGQRTWRVWRDVMWGAR